eukprot:symbB.v1.2.000415.t1/scaffold30.1/size407774/31
MPQAPNIMSSHETQTEPESSVQPEISGDAIAEPGATTPRWERRVLDLLAEESPKREASQAAKRGNEVGPGYALKELAKNADKAKELKKTLRKDHRQQQRQRSNVLIPCLLLLVLAISLAGWQKGSSGLRSGVHSRSNSTKVPIEVILQYEALPADSAAHQRHVQVMHNVSRGPKPPPIPWPPHLPRFMQHKSISNSSLATRATSAIMQSTIDYWVDCCTRWSERLGLREELMKDPVLELLRSAARSAVPTEEERKKLQEQREWYYHDSSVFYVMLTLRLGFVGFVLSLFAFESLLQGWIFGDLGQALAVPRLFFSPAKAAELSFQGFGCSSIHSRKPRGYKREVFRRIITGQVPCRLHQLLRRVMTLEDIMKP